MVGDGLSIDPSSAVLVAACDGEVMSLHAAGHAVTLRTAEGLELLMHVGIDTVTLKGEGFKPRVKVGDKVKAGAPLIEFDLDFLATHAKSLLTQDRRRQLRAREIVERASGLVAGKDTLFTVDFGEEERRGFHERGEGGHFGSDCDSQSHRTARAARRRCWPISRKRFQSRDQAPARRSAGECAQRDRHHGSRRHARRQGANHCHRA
jgi:phosphocarrier protein FPr